MYIFRLKTEFFYAYPSVDANGCARFTCRHTCACHLLECLMPLQKMDFSKKFPDADPLAIDLMQRMLEFDPRKRIDVEGALKHPWLAQLHDEAAEPSAPGARTCTHTHAHTVHMHINTCAHTCMPASGLRRPIWCYALGQYHVWWSCLSMRISLVCCFAVTGLKHNTCECTVCLIEVHSRPGLEDEQVTGAL